MAGATTNCGLQVCSHPSCWISHRVTDRRLNELNYLVKTGRPPKQISCSKPEKKKLPKYEGHMTDNLPKMSIVNVSHDPISLTKKKSMSFQPEKHAISPNASKTSLEFVPVNTPREALSFHTQPFSFDSDVPTIQTSLAASMHTTCKHVNLSLDRNIQPSQKKQLVWKPTNRFKSYDTTAMSSESSLSIQYLPLRYKRLSVSEIPQYKSRASISRQNIRGRKVNDGLRSLLPPPPAFHRLPQTAKREPSKVVLSKTELKYLQQMQPENFHCLLMKAVDNKVLTEKQAQTLLQQVQYENGEINEHLHLPPLTADNDIKIGSKHLIVTNENNDRMGLVRKSFILKKSLPSSLIKMNNNKRKQILKLKSEHKLISSTTSRSSIQFMTSDVLKKKENLPTHDEEDEEESEYIKFTLNANRKKRMKRKTPEKLQVNKKIENQNVDINASWQSFISFLDSSIEKDEYYPELDFSADEPMTARESFSPFPGVRYKPPKTSRTKMSSKSSSARDFRDLVNIHDNKVTNEVDKMKRTTSATLIMDYNGLISPDPPPPSPIRKRSVVQFNSNININSV